MPILFIDFSPKGLNSLISEQPGLLSPDLLARLSRLGTIRKKRTSIRITQKLIDGIYTENTKQTLNIFCRNLQKTQYIPVQTTLIIFCFPRIDNAWNVKKIASYNGHRRLCVRSTGGFKIIRTQLEAVWKKIEQTPSDNDDPLNTLITSLTASKSLFAITSQFLERGQSSSGNQTRKSTATLIIPMNMQHIQNNISFGPIAPTTIGVEIIDGNQTVYPDCKAAKPDLTLYAGNTHEHRFYRSADMPLPQHRKTNKHALQVMMLYTALSAIALSLVLIHYGYCLTFMHSFSLGANVTFATFFVGIVLIARQIKLYSGFNGSTKIQSSTRYLFNDTIGMFGNPVGLNIASILTFLVLSEHLPTLFSLSKGSTIIVVGIAALIVVNTIDRACSHGLRAQLYKDSERSYPDDLLKPAPSTYYQPAALSLLLYAYYTTRQTTPVMHSNALRSDNDDCKMESPKR